MEQNLYKVICRGMKDSHGFAYVVASDPTEAYQKMRNYLNAKDLGFSQGRELESITLIAKSSSYPNPDVTALYL